MSAAFLNILFVTLGLITFASTINLILKKIYPQKEVFKKVSSIINGWWFIISFVLICFGLAPIGLLVGFGLVTVFGLREYLRHSQLTNIRMVIMTLVSIALVLQYYSLWLEAWSVFFALPLIFILLGFPTIVVATGAIEKLPLVFSSYVGLLLISHFVAYFPATYLYTVQNLGGDVGIYFSFFIIMLTELNDIFQFLAGKAFGKRKLVALVSPSKTEAGFLGGLTGTSLVSYLLLHTFLGFEWFHALTIGVLISFSGILGDLCFSAIKRYFGIKDFSDFLPGHGGVFDRLDSLVFTTPITFFYIYLIKGF